MPQLVDLSEHVANAVVEFAVFNNVGPHVRDLLVGVGGLDCCFGEMVGSVVAEDVTSFGWG